VYDKALISTLGIAALLALVALPLIFRKIPRNHAYGFRTPGTLRDDGVWYEANAHGGRGLVVAALAGALLELLLYENGRGLDPQTYLRATIAALVVPMTIAIIRTLLFIRTLTR